MPDIRTNGWCRIEGCQIANLYREYGTLVNIPNSEQHVYFGTPEIQIDNPYSSTHSTIYRITPIAELGINDQINEIDQQWENFISNIQTWMNTHTVDGSDSHTAYYSVGKPFVVSQSSVIFYDDSSKGSITGSKYNNYAIILVDKLAVPSVINITAKYKGDVVPVDEPFDQDLLEVVAQYDDGNEVKITSNYFIEPEDKIVTQLGANIFEIVYIDPDGDANRTTVVINGCRNLQGITGYWDGGQVAYGRDADKKFFVIIAHYSDNTESTVTDFTFVNGNQVTENNQGLIDIFYKGYTCQVQVDAYKFNSSRLIAYYNGPYVDVGSNFLPDKLDIKIYYSSAEAIEKGEYETINVEDCILESTKVTQEGVNTFNISYNGQLGLITTSFTVIGIVPDLKITTMEAEYNGPGVYQGNTFDLERINCKIFYNNGTIKTVKNFTVSTNIVHTIGQNEITVTYTEDSVTVSDIIIVEGLERDSTTDNNIFPTSLKNNYPRATILNNRYRGPAEGIKTNDYANMIIHNVNDLYRLFASIEKQYNQIIADVTDDTSVKITTLNNVSYMQHQLNGILTDDHYTTGIYKSEDTNI